MINNQRCPRCNAIMERMDWIIKCSNNKCAYFEEIEIEENKIYTLNEDDLK